MFHIMSLGKCLCGIEPKCNKNTKRVFKTSKQSQFRKSGTLYLSERFTDHITTHKSKARHNVVPQINFKEKTENVIDVVSIGKALANLPRNHFANRNVRHMYDTMVDLRVKTDDNTYQLCMDKVASKNGSTLRFERLSNQGLQVCFWNSFKSLLLPII